MPNFLGIDQDIYYLRNLNLHTKDFFVNSRFVSQVHLKNYKLFLGKKKVYLKYMQNLLLSITFRCLGCDLAQVTI